MGKERYRTWRFALVLAAAMLLLSGSRFPVKAAPADPLGWVKQAVDEILSILQDPRLAVPERKEERRQLVIKVVERHFDFVEISRRALARHWRRITPEERQRFVDLFRQLLESSYIDRVDSYSNEKVEFRKQEIRGNKAMVYTVFVKKDTEIPVNYMLKKENDRWVVYDVVIEGVSLVRNYRTQFDSILQKEDFPTLLARMQEKINKPAPAQAASP